MAKRVLMVSGDSDHKVHFREWSVKQLGDIDWDDEFDKMLTHYKSNGHRVTVNFDTWDERLITVIGITNGRQFSFPMGDRHV